MKSFLGGHVTLWQGDCREVLREFADNSVDSVVTDPPYELNFMDRKWDNTGIANDTKLWAEVLRVLKPGGYIVAFASSRGYHRMACAIEDAGFITHPMIGWVFGSGFPKAHSVAKQIDRMAGAERSVIGTAKRRDIRNGHGRGRGDGINASERKGPEYLEYSFSAPATEAAKQWDGWYYGRQALKPSLEPIYCGQKPFERGLNGTQNVLKHGVVALNIDACRIAVKDDYGRSAASANGERSAYGASGIYGGQCARQSDYVSPNGRWPANLCHDGSEEVLAEFPDADGQHSDLPRDTYSNNGMFLKKKTLPFQSRSDSGSAARFFFQAKMDCLCGLCGLPLITENDIKSSCYANNAASIFSTENIPIGDFALCDAADSQALENEDKNHLLNNYAGDVDVERCSDQCPPQNEGSVQSNVQVWTLSKIAQNVRSAGNLCALCATDIARSLAALRQGQPPGSLHSLVSISGRKKQILIDSLALYAEGRESTDIILTIPSLKQLLGSVLHAIDNCIKLGSQSGPSDLKRFHYDSKADTHDRIGSRHPTVKPVSLMQWLVRLVTPKGGGVCLDLFAGTGTTAEACFREGMRCILIEREAESIADIERRMKLCLAGPGERARESIKARGLTADPGPLFQLAKE